MEKVASRKDIVAEQTFIRRALLRNGYSPFPCAGKSGQIDGWPDIKATDALIDEWAEQMRWVSTAVHTGVNGLVGIDVDIDDAAVLADFVERLPEALWDRLQHAPVRRGGGVKEMWLVRLAEGEVARRYKDTTGKWGNPESDADDADHKIEVWAKDRKLLALYGARTLEGRTATSWYSWVEDRGPHCVPVSDLPEITNEDIDVLLRCAVAAMQAHGWQRLDITEPTQAAERMFDLTSSMRFTTRDYGEVSLDELIDLCGALEEVRMYSWLPGKRRRADRCAAKLNDYDGLLQIYDHDTGTLHRTPEADGAYARKMLEGARESIAQLGARLHARQAPEAGRAEDMKSSGSRLDALLAAVPVERRLFQESAVEEGGGEPVGRADGKMTVQIVEGELHETSEETVRLLCERHDRLFDMGGLPVVVDEDMKVRQARGDRLAHEMQRVLDFITVKKTSKGVAVSSVEPPKSLVGRVEALAHAFPALRAVVDMPVLRRDGRLVEEGYDPASGLLVLGGRDVAADVPEKVSDEVARQALEFLWKPFSEFPFAGGMDKGGALAAVLTAALRPVLPTAPMFVFDAPTQGSGKTLLSMAVGALAGGAQLMAPLPSKDEAEVRKILLAVLLESPRAVVFDNHWGMLDSAVLAGMLTSEVFGGRLLGTNTTLKAPTSVLVMVTGNNVLLGGETPRRSVRIRIDAGMDAPFTRSFGFCPHAFVREHRAPLVAAALTLVRWSLSSAVRGRIGSFEVWDEMIGQTVAKIGAMLDDSFVDPAEGIKAAHADDPRRDELGEMLHALRDEFGNKWFTGADVAARLTGSGGMTSHPLLDALGLDKAPSSKTVGRLLTYRRDAVVDGFRVQVGRDYKTKLNRFRVWSDADAEDVLVDGVTEIRRAEQRTKLKALPSRT